MVKINSALFWNFSLDVSSQTLLLSHRSGYTGTGITTTASVYLIIQIKRLGLANSRGYHISIITVRRCSKGGWWYSRLLRKKKKVRKDMHYLTCGLVTGCFLCRACCLSAHHQPEGHNNWWDTAVHGNIFCCFSDCAENCRTDLT